MRKLDVTAETGLAGFGYGALCLTAGNVLHITISHVFVGFCVFVMRMCV